MGEQQVPIKSLKVKVQSVELVGMKADAETATAGEQEMMKVEQPAKGSKK